jgi:hypothetical protein
VEDGATEEKTQSKSKAAANSVECFASRSDARVTIFAQEKSKACDKKLAICQIPNFVV